MLTLQKKNAGIYLFWGGENTDNQTYFWKSNSSVLIRLKENGPVPISMAITWSDLFTMWRMEPKAEHIDDKIYKIYFLFI